MTEDSGKAGSSPGEAHYKELEGQIESLMKCTPLPEGDVKNLCEKAREILQVKGLYATISAPSHRY